MEQNTDKYKSENGKLLSTFLRLQDGTVINMSHISAISPISENTLPGENGVVY